MKDRTTKFKGWTSKGENWWLILAIFLTLLATTTNLIFLKWISAANAHLSTVEKLDVFKIVGGALIAGITFATVIWRGLVSARQADEQRRANNSKDEENTARLMFDGAKLIGEVNDASIVAGIAGLEVVIKTPNSPFATTAMSVLADFITKNIAELNKNTTIEQARLAMEEGVARNIFAQRKIRVDQSAKHPEADYRTFNSFSSVEYVGVSFSKAFFESIRPTQDTHFELCTMIAIDQMSVDRNFTNCRFTRCSFLNLSMDDQGSHTFSYCDFSNCKVDLTHPIPIEELDEEVRRFMSSFYYRDSPPTGDGAHLILPYLEARDRPAQ